MNRYDTTFIVNPQVGDDDINASVNAITEIITSNKGTVLRERRIGSRRLAYPIGSQSHGYYVSLIHDCDPSVLPKLERRFKLEDAYLRDLTIRYDGDPFRKLITDVMMGSDSDDRRPSDDRPSRYDRKPRSRDDSRSASSSPAPTASPAPKAVPAESTAKPAETPASGTEENKAPVESKPDSTPEAEAKTPAADMSGEETL